MGEVTVNQERRGPWAGRSQYLNGNPQPVYLDRPNVVGGVANIQAIVRAKPSQRLRILLIRVHTERNERRAHLRDGLAREGIRIFCSACCTTACRHDGDEHGRSEKRYTASMKHR